MNKLAKVKKYKKYLFRWINCQKSKSTKSLAFVLKIGKYFNTEKNSKYPEKTSFKSLKHIYSITIDVQFCTIMQLKVGNQVVDIIVNIIPRSKYYTRIWITEGSDGASLFSLIC